MKKRIVFFATAVFLTVLTGCGTEAPSDSSAADGGEKDGATGLLQDGGMSISAAENDGNRDGGGNENSGGNGDYDAAGKDSGTDKESIIIKLRIVDGAETGNLILAGESGYEIYSLSLRNYDWLPEQASMPKEVNDSMQDVPVYLDGQPADSTVLEDGMMIEIEYSGMVEETFPVRLVDVYSVYAYSLGTEQNPGGGYYDLCGLYLQVLEDLWEKDSGLNGGANLISVDLSKAPGELTEGEQQAIAWIFASRHGATSLTLSYEELAKTGYLTEIETGQDREHKLYQWEDGILFSITPAEWGGGETSSLPVLIFNAQKWRTPLGAYYFSDCMAVWPEMGPWEDYEIGGEAIS